MPHLHITPHETVAPAKRERPSWRAAVALVSVGALAAAALVTRMTIGGDEAIADPSRGAFVVDDATDKFGPRATTPTPSPAPAPPAAQPDPTTEPASALQRIEQIERDAKEAAARIEAELATDTASDDGDRVPLKLDEPARAAPSKPKASKSKKSSRAKPSRRASTSTSTSTSPPPPIERKPSANSTEDLYDTR